MFQDIQKRNR